MTQSWKRFVYERFLYTLLQIGAINIQTQLALRAYSNSKKMSFVDPDTAVVGLNGTTR